MMGTLGPKQPSLFAYDVNLELRIPSNHPLRQVKQTLDLSFIDAVVKDCYGSTGNRSVPPQILMRMLFLLFYYNIPSERELFDQIALRLDFLWFLELDLDSDVPNHSILSKARARWGSEVFQELFVRTVEQCVRAGLVDGKLLHIDSTIVAANASKDSVVKSSPELIAALRQACREQEQKLEVLALATPAEAEAAAELVLESISGPILTPLTIAANAELPMETSQSAATPEPESAAHALQETVRKLAPKAAGKKDAPVNQTHVSLRDPQAELARDKSGVTRLSYKEHRMVDDAYGVITAVKTTAPNVADGVELPNLYPEHQGHTRLLVIEPAIAADKHYGTAENYRYCLQQGLRPHMAEAVNGVEGRGLFDPKRFVYQPEHDQFRCPAGQALVLHQRRPELKVNTYLIQRPELCAQCPLQSQCTKSKRGRSLQVPEDYTLIEGAREQANSPAARRSRRRRRHVMEGSFADAMNNHGAKRARWRGLERQKIQSCMIAAIQNLRILLKHHRKPVSLGVGSLVPFPQSELRIQKPAQSCRKNSQSRPSTSISAWGKRNKITARTLRESCAMRYAS
jgi:transposase